MTSPITYWRERLEHGCIFANKKRLTDMHHVYYSTVTRTEWPAEVALEAIYEDYVQWWRERYVQPLLETEPYKSNIKLLPNQLHNRSFHTILRPFLYLSPGDKPKMRRVKLPRYYQGAWYGEDKQLRFLKLRPLVEHIHVYEKLTGSVIVCHRSNTP